jgi:hypothetical protein
LWLGLMGMPLLDGMKGLTWGGSVPLSIRVTLLLARIVVT